MVALKWSNRFGSVGLGLVFCLAVACGGDDGGGIVAGGDGDGDGDGDQGDGDGDQGEPDSGAEDAATADPLGDASAGNFDGDPDGIWRPFLNESVWNTTIPEEVTVDPESEAMIEDIASLGGITIEMGAESVPMFIASSATPRVPMLCARAGFGFEDLAAMVPMPVEAEDTTGYLLVLDRTANTEWGFSEVARVGDAWSCGSGASIDMGELGVRPSASTSASEAIGPRACGFPLVAGLIRREAIEGERIPHALVMTYPHVRAGFYTEPASTGQAAVGEDAVSTRGIPCGGRVHLKRSVNLDELGLTPEARVIASTLQLYGAFIGGYAESITLYAESSDEAQADWEGVLEADALSGLSLSDFVVLEMGELEDYGNGE
jgi:hypothetical protein